MTDNYIGFDITKYTKILSKEEVSKLYITEEEVAALENHLSNICKTTKENENRLIEILPKFVNSFNNWKRIKSKKNRRRSDYSRNNESKERK